MEIHITRKHVVESMFLLFLCAVWFLIGWLVRGWRQGPDVALVEQARQQLLSKHYPGQELARRDLTYAAIEGMLRHTGDPHAALFEPPASERFEDDFAGRSGVIGLFPEVRDGEMVVSLVFPGEPADRAGLRPGDVILSVDGVEFDETITGPEASLLIRGPVGTSANFVVTRGDETLSFNPVREEREIVSARMLESDFGYLAQYTFTANAPGKVRQALQDLLASQPRGLIWDLRENGGGSMEAAQEILTYFIEDGLLFTAELKGGKRRPFLADGETIAADIPLVVLIGEHTFSSAETAAAAISERGRGLLIGGTTHGKGTIQETVPLIEDCLLHFTIAKWLSPTGQWYEGRGVAPDIAVSDDPATDEDEVLRFATDYLLPELIP